jgi:hypothetical protein
VNSELTRLRIEDLGTHDVGRKQVDGELDSFEVEFDRPADRLDEERLRSSWNAFEQKVASGEERDQDPLDDDFLTDHGLGDTGRDGLCKGRAKADGRGIGGVVAFGHDLVESLEDEVAVDGNDDGWIAVQTIFMNRTEAQRPSARP